MQKDMLDYYYNCRLKKLEVESMYNMPYVVNCTFERDSIYVWQPTKTVKHIPTIFPYSFRFVNNSSEDTMKPIYEFSCNSSEGTIILKNTTTGEDMALKNLQDGEKITINSDTLTVISNKRQYILDNFNLNFMRLVEGVHNFVLDGNVSELKITYQNAKKIGG